MDKSPGRERSRWGLAMAKSLWPLWGATEPGPRDGTNNRFYHLLELIAAWADTSNRVPGIGSWLGEALPRRQYWPPDPGPVLQGAGSSSGETGKSTGTSCLFMATLPHAPDRSAGERTSWTHALLPPLVGRVLPPRNQSHMANPVSPPLCPVPVVPVFGRPAEGPGFIPSPCSGTEQRRQSGDSVFQDITVGLRVETGSGTSEHRLRHIPIPTCWAAAFGAEGPGLVRRAMPP